MNEESKKEERPKTPEWEKYFQQFLSAVPPIDSSKFGSAEQTLKTISDNAQKLGGQISITAKAMMEVFQEATNLKGVDVRFKTMRVLDMKMHIVKEADVPLNRDIVGLGKIEALRMYKLVHLQAELSENNKELSLQIVEGLALVVSIVFFGVKQIVPLKGKAKIIRDAKGQLLVEATANIPGTEMPVTVTFPLKQIFDEVRKSGLKF